jgi:hypothetical protein
MPTNEEVEREIERINACVTGRTWSGEAEKQPLKTPDDLAAFVEIFERGFLAFAPADKPGLQEIIRLARLGAAVEAMPHGYALERDAAGEWNIYWVAHNGGGGPTLNFIGYGSTAEEAMRLHCNLKT